MKRPIRWKQLLHKLLFPHPAVVLVCVPAAAALLVWVFAVAGEDSPAAYAVYPFSAYALVIACTGLGGMVRRLTAWLLHFSLAERLVRDVPFRARVTLYLSLGINLLYVGMNGVSGVRQRSVWFGTMAVYYLFLAGMRFSLVRYARRAGPGADQAGEYRRYRLCGILLVLMNLALGGVVVLVLHREGGFSYSGYMIYAMAAYAFYATIMGGGQPGALPAVPQPGAVRLAGGQPGRGAGVDAVAGGGHAGPVRQRQRRGLPHPDDRLHRLRRQRRRGGHGRFYDRPRRPRAGRPGPGRSREFSGARNADGRSAPKGRGTLTDGPAARRAPL